MVITPARVVVAVVVMVVVVASWYVVRQRQSHLIALPCPGIRVSGLPVAFHRFAFAADR